MTKHSSQNADPKTVFVIGGGAAGFFAAITAAERGHRVTILEAAKDVLAKVRISGGGRCNVTHHCFDPRELVTNYPRGGKQLRGPFAKFQPQDTVEWYAAHGVETKVEPDGRMFPVTDDSMTIVNCLRETADRLGVRVRTSTRVTRIRQADGQFTLATNDDEELMADCVVLATGGARGGFELAKSMGHEIVAPVPSLFTFQMSDTRLAELQGVAVANVTCQLLTESKKFKQTGPLLITHWGMSGPAVLKLSAWAARELHDANYAAKLRVNWLFDAKADDVRHAIGGFKKEHAKKSLESVCPWSIPKRLWKSLVDHCGATETRWAELSKKVQQRLVNELVDGEFQVRGKGQFKEEFVTCGGVKLKEVDFRTMESRLVPGLFFAGEVLDVDAVTGGFNFQNAWTTAWIAGNSI